MLIIQFKNSFILCKHTLIIIIIQSRQYRFTFSSIFNLFSAWVYDLYGLV